MKIVCLKNGPYLFELKEGEKIALCRCGNSSNKPFCDGKHKEVKFEAQEGALDERGKLQSAN